MNMWLGKNGYLMVSPMILGKRKKYLVHRLIAMTFCPGFASGLCVDHIDGDRLNNHAANLDWVTLSENTRRQNADGRGVPKGDNHPSAKLRDADIPEVLRLVEAGVTHREIAEKFSISTTLVYKVKRGRRIARHSHVLGT